MPSTLNSDDLFAIHGLLARYGHLIEARDFPALAGLFAPDGILDFTEMGIPAVISGRNEIQAFYTGVQHPAAHHCTNIDVVSIGDDGQECSLRSKWFVPDGDRGVRGGDYYDTLRRTEEGWRFLQRRGTRRFG